MDPHDGSAGPTPSQCAKAVTATAIPAAPLRLTCVLVATMITSMSRPPGAPAGRQVSLRGLATRMIAATLQIHACDAT